ncbi:hypothetical protein KQX54_009926 [Cotesia glomerata]|uniref:Uncharacterized protein n=1 Tax=Cotesia glomerata TaxID=32391 RepID=A0AAV7IZL4_COTGL|nr:hypothetical protein KQX54_009926 [Cotesia glomerata]
MGTRQSKLSKDLSTIPPGKFSPVRENTQEFRKTRNLHLPTNNLSTMERDQLGQRGPGDEISANLVRGLDHLRNPQLNKVSLDNFNNYSLFFKIIYSLIIYFFKRCDKLYVILIYQV